MFGNINSNNNQWSQLLSNMNNFGGIIPISGNTTLSGNTLSGDTSSLNLLPMAIKMAAKTIGLDLVTVQPLSAPIGKTFGFDYMYGETAEQKAERIRKERDEKLKEIFGEDYEKFIKG